LQFLMTTISCFSYLASVRTLHVESFPPINYGVDIERADTFLAGDGPLVAGFLRALGHEAVLHSNQVADDAEGREVAARLASWQVPVAQGPAAVSATRINTVVADYAGNRTWFSGLRGIMNDFHGMDIAQLTAAQVLYLDCYEVLGQGSRPILDVALQTACDVIINLGGSPVPGWLGHTVHQRRAAVLQTNADENRIGDAMRALDELSALGVADIVIVTAGRAGAFCRSSDGSTIATPAKAVRVQQVQGAGAAFSAALIHARQAGAEVAEALRFACAAGSLWCSRTHHGALPGADDIDAFAAAS
jgi:sugar/nucleoside kinase (ribokinase family)